MLPTSEQSTTSAQLFEQSEQFQNTNHLPWLYVKQVEICSG
jgi:hypothetical protein